MNATAKQFLEVFNPMKWLPGSWTNKQEPLTYPRVAFWPEENFAEFPSQMDKLALDNYINDGYFTQAEKQQLQAIISECISAENAIRWNYIQEAQSAKEVAKSYKEIHSEFSELWKQQSDKCWKVEVKIDPWDVWNFDHTLCMIIHPGLLALKEAKAGTPFIYKEDLPESIPWDADDAYNPEGWAYILDEMIYAFDPEWDATYGYYTKPYDQLKHQENYKRKQNGQRLFGKYFDNLWT